MLARSRPWLLALTLGFLTAAVLTAILGPGLPALAQSSRAGAIAPPLEPFRSSGSLTVGPGLDDTVELTPPVPAGKLLVVESVFASLLIGGVDRAVLQIGPAGEEVPIPIILQFSSPGFVAYVTSPTATRFYVGAAGPPLRGKVARFDPSEEAVADFTVVGHLVPAPAP